MYNKFDPNEMELRDRVRASAIGDVGQTARVSSYDMTPLPTGGAAPAPGKSAEDIATVAEPASQTMSVSSGGLSAGLGGAASTAQAAGLGGPVGGALQGGATGASVGGPYGAAIGAGVGLAAGLFADKAKREEMKRQRVIKSLEIEMEGKQKAYEQLGQQSGAAIRTSLAGFGRALG